MKKILISSLFLFSLLLHSQQNAFLNSGFWGSKPTVEQVKEAIEKGNNPAEFNPSAFDPVTLAINSKAPFEVITYLISQPGNSVDKITHDGRIYLHWAAMSGNKQLIEYLIEKGSDVNKLDTKGLTHLSFAAMFGLSDAEVYDLFFQSGVAPKHKYKNGANILLLAIGNDKDGSLLKLFNSKGLALTDTDDKGSTAFDYAASFGNIELLKSFRKKGIKATDVALLNAAQGTRRITNGIAVYQYLIDEVKLKPLSVNSDGATALQIVARKPNQSEIINYLISKGEDPNKTDNDGNNALMIASAGRDLNNIKVLLPKTKSINAVNANGESALSNAVKSSSSEVTAYLLENNADVNVKDIKGNNLAYYLIQSYKSGASAGNEKDKFNEKITLLKNKGLDITAPQKDGSTLLHLAVAKNNLDLLKKIVALNIPVNQADNEKMTPLHKAALIAKDDTILKYLISLGADKNAKTEFEETAYDLASENETLVKNKTSIDFLK